jgi:hypothetical protein
MAASIQEANDRSLTCRGVHVCLFPVIIVLSISSSDSSHTLTRARQTSFADAAVHGQ